MNDTMMMPTPYEPSAEMVQPGTLEAVQRQTEAVTLHQRIVATYQSINMLLTDYCRLLKDMRDKKLYRELGCKTFDEYVESRAGIKARQAYTYISTYERLGEKRLAEHGALGITKLSLLAQMFPTDADELAAGHDLAGMTTKQVQELVEKATRQGEQLSMLEAEVKDAESQEAFWKREFERVQAEMAQQLADALTAAQPPVIEAAVTEQSALDAARQQANEELAQRLADAAEKAEREKVEAVRKAEEKARAEMEALRQKMAAERSEYDKRLNDATLKRQKAVASAEKKAAAAAREEALKQAEEDKQKAVEAAVAAAKQEAAAQAEKDAAGAAAEVEKLKKQLKVAQDRDTMRYALMFDQLQATTKGMHKLLDAMRAEGKDAEARNLAETSAKALQQLAKQFVGA
ncbi:MAG: hypothetical protein IJ347_03205 [Faecalibacterium sp.]|nr:hypothetical protein [Faecalibacterium sp.]